MILYQLSVFLHILSAIIWIGGMLFVALVIVPTTRGMPAPERAALFSAVGLRFRTVGWICIGVLIVTGTINAMYRGVSWANVFTAELWASPFGSTLAMKLAVVTLLLALSLYHDFVIGPASVKATEQATPKGRARSESLRRRASKIGRVEALLALVVLALAIMLVRGVPTF